MANYPPFAPTGVVKGTDGTLGGPGGTQLVPAAAFGSRISRRVQAMLTNAASAPVFTLDGALAGYVTLAAGAAPFVFENAQTMSPLGVYLVTAVGGGANQLTPFRVAFDHDGQLFRLRPFGNGAPFRVWANEQPSPWFIPPNDGLNTHTVLVDFGSRAYRRIVVEADPNSLGATYQFAFWGGVDRLPSDTVFPPTLPPAFRLAVVGDSYAVGTGATHSSTGYFTTLARLLGTQNTRCLAVPATGWTASATPYGLAARTTELAAAAPDLLLAQGSVNDTGGNGTIGPAVAAWVTTVRAALPATKIVLTGTMRPGAATANDLLANTDIKNAATAAGLPFIDPQAGPWFNGTGAAGAPIGDGNADFYLTNADHLHPTQAGHDAIAARLARELALTIGIAA